MTNSSTYSMKQVCQKTGLTYDTLKYYCNEGLIPNVKRDAHNFRIFDDRDVAWIESLKCLKNCNMSLSEMKSYLALCQKGKETVPARQAILESKLSELQAEIARLESSIDFIHWKQQLYQDFLTGKQEYYSNLAPVED